MELKPGGELPASHPLFAKPWFSSRAVRGTQPSPSLRVRLATPADLDALLSLYVQLSRGNAGTDRAEAAEAFEQMLHRAGLSVFVAEAAGAVVGTATLVVVPNLTHGAQPWAQLENMVVAESARGTGVGATLLRYAVQAAWDAGCYKVQLQSDNARSGAHRFYEREGFAATSQGYRLYRH
jgi:GNAT superfamily N-acetyltransferase